MRTIKFNLVEGHALLKTSTRKMLESFKYNRKAKGLKLFDYVIMTYLVHAITGHLKTFEHSELPRV